MKYTFALPDAALRKEFVLKWIAKVQTLGAVAGVVFEEPQEMAAAVVEKTEGWSFAFLKELFVFVFVTRSSSPADPFRVITDSSRFSCAWRTTSRCASAAQTCPWSRRARCF